MRGVELGQLDVRGKDDANRGRARGAAGFEGGPNCKGDTITRNDGWDAGPNRDVDPEGREVDAGRRALAVARIQTRSWSRVYAAPPSPGFPGSTTLFCG